MPARWTKEVENQKRKELYSLYVTKNLSIMEISKSFSIAYQTVYDQLIRLSIPITPERKAGFFNKRQVKTPSEYTSELAEFTGIMLGDGHISPTTGQFYVTLNHNDDKKFIEFVSKLMERLFDTYVTKIRRKKQSVTNILITSVDLLEFLSKIGLYSSNKVKDQVDVPIWIKRDPKFWKPFVRGFFDTDGSIYKLKFGIQMAFKNHSIPLLTTTKQILTNLAYHPSRISSNHIYLTRREELKRYADEIGFSNSKHFSRAKFFGIIISA